MKLELRAVQVASLAYKDAQAFNDAGYYNVAGITDEDTSTQAFIVEDDDYLYLTFTGTESFTDLITDLRFLKKKAFGQFRLHRGFWEAWRSVSDRVAGEVMQRQLDAKANEDIMKPVVYCGHSLGAALVTIAAATHNPNYCITFGSPPVGGKRFRTHTAEANTLYLRYALDGDPVPRLLKWNPFYRHVGRLLFIDSEGETHINPSWWSALKMRLSGSRDITDHAVRSYHTQVFLDKEGRCTRN